MVQVPLEVFDKFKELMTTESLELMQRVAEHYRFGGAYKVSAGNAYRGIDIIKPTLEELSKLE
ncbi:MAG: hypothetical protein QXU32_03280 [Nitrososphaerales archaeon]